MTIAGTENVNPAIFRAYDIRGLVGSDLTEEVLTILGRAAGTYFHERGWRTCVVGRDARCSSCSFQQAFMEGLQSTGQEVLDIGEVPTPVMYFAVEHLGTDSGVVISASHNPPEYNGVKLRQSHPVYGSEPLYGQALQDLYQIASRGQFVQGRGTLRRTDVRDAYTRSVVSLLRLPDPYLRPPKRPRVVLDGGNGVAGPIGYRVLEAIGAEVIPLYLEPDGTFPNHHPDPLKAHNLQDLVAAVRTHHADVGFALDGDGDRLGVVDGNGEIIWADRYLIVLAQYLLSQRRGAVVFDVKCSMVLEEAIRAFGGTPVMSKTGYASISAMMRQTNAVLGGELSGHTFATYPGHYYDDGTFAAAHLLRALCYLDQEAGGTPADARMRSLTDILSPYPALPSIMEDRLRFTDHTKFHVIDFVRQRFAGRYPLTEIDGVRVHFGDGWGIVRASNTEPVITTRFEATTHERVAAIRDMMLSVVEEFRRTLR
ncbi:MAG: phosphomannomutase/phosphoglucomutase [Chloroflexaceae bacterium]|nr:phosphomannomutase/phosphoglucomutase [Chloroflexaceae bacterium]